MVNATLYLLHYNNYYNRIVKRSDYVADYVEYSLGSPITGVNFNPNDFVNTTQIVNWTDQDPDYVVVVDENNDIHSRWFVISTSRVRQGQLELELHRDLIADGYNEILNNPCFIEKALPQSIRDPAIYNSEDMTFNQIKQKEILLKDETRCPWIVGYIPRDSFKTDTTVTVTAQLGGTEDITVEHLSDYEFYKYNDSIVNGAVTNPTIKVIVTYWLMQKTSTGSYRNYYYANSIKLNQNGVFTGMDKGSGQTSTIGYWWQQTSNNILNVPSNAFTDEYAKTVVKNMHQLANDFKDLSDYVDTGGISDAEYTRLLNDNGKVIYETSTGKYFKIKLTGTTSSSQTERQIPWNSSLGIKMRDKIVKNFDGHSLVDPINPSNSIYNPFRFTSDTAFQTLSFEPIEVNISVKVPATRYKASESPYDIFCMPYSDNLKIMNGTSTYISKTNASAALTIAQEIMAKVGSNNIYDVQLLPYCPVRYCIRSNGAFDINGVIYNDVLAGTNKVSVLLWASSDNFQFNLQVPISEKQSIIEKKVENETSFVRFVSPNFSNSFEFKPQMNNGLDYVTVLCHYKPFNPYIKLQPNFKGMYGNNFNDARGLICNGDFSLAQVTSAWRDYENNNKNYNAIFNREMQSLTLRNSVQREQEIWGIAAGTIGAGVSGAGAGMMAAGPWGALAGIGTAGVSLAGGLRDLELNDKLRNDALDYKRDMFGYQMQNIQALPYGLAKTSAISPDNKYFPFIEFYSCSDEEKQALRDKIKYNGATIMRIGKIADYLTGSQQYIKGRLIKAENIAEDYHVVNALADEIFKGMFITGTGSTSYGDDLLVPPDQGGEYS